MVDEDGGDIQLTLEELQAALIPTTSASHSPMPCAGLAAKALPDDPSPTSVADRSAHDFAAGQPPPLALPSHIRVAARKVLTCADLEARAVTLQPPCDLAAAPDGEGPVVMRDPTGRQWSLRLRAAGAHGGEPCHLEGLGDFFHHANASEGCVLEVGTDGSAAYIAVAPSMPSPTPSAGHAGRARDQPEDPQLLEPEGPSGAATALDGSAPPAGVRPQPGRIRIWWAVDRCWRTGTVSEPDAAGAQMVVYDDGHRLWHELHKERWEPAEAAAALSKEPLGPLRKRAAPPAPRGPTKRPRATKREAVPLPSKWVHKLPEDVEVLFEKQLTKSDMVKMGRIIVPKSEALKAFSGVRPNETVRAQDADGRSWDFLYRQWPNVKSTMHVLDHVVAYAKAYDLQPGDAILLGRGDGPAFFVGSKRQDPPLPSADQAAEPSPEREGPAANGEAAMGMSTESEDENSEANHSSDKALTLSL